MLEHFERTDFRGEAIATTGVLLTRFSPREPVIFAGDETTPAAPRLAVRYVADNADDTRAPRPEKWLIVADAQTGQVLFKESLIVFDVQGTVRGLVTEGSRGMQCAAEVETPLPDAQVNIASGASGFTDQSGAFSILHDGANPVTVTTALSGRYFDVIDVGGATELLSLSVTQPGPADFLHNADNVSELVRAQANGYANANQVRTWALSLHPTYPVIATQLDFPVRVNHTTGYCPGNAWYDYSSINFCRSSTTHGNTSFASVSHHEYGHHLVSSGGSGQGAYGEGMSDVVSMLIADDPGIGYGFYTQCDTPLRTADNTCQYSAGCSTCGSAVHACGQLLSGAIWDVRDALRATNPTTYLEIVSNLALNSILLHTGTTITAQIAIDFLILDDDDANLNNGTPHRAEICEGFGAHNLPCPVLPNFFAVTMPDSATENAGVLSGQGTVSMNMASGTPVTANLGSSQPALVAVPATVTIPAGALSATFDLTIGDNALLDGSRMVTVTASGPLPAASRSLAVHDDEVGVLSVTIPAGVTEGDGVLTGEGLVTVDRTVDADVTVLLLSSEPAQIGVPASVTVPAGSQSAAFDVFVDDNGAIDGSRVVNVTAEVVNWTSGSTSTTIADDESRELELVLPESVVEGAGVQAATVRIAGTLAEALTVGIASGRPDLLGAPATVVIPAGSTSAAFDLSPIDDTEPELAQAVTLSAQADGFSDASATLDLLDDDASHLRVTLLGSTPARASAPLAIRVEAIGADGSPLAGYARSATVTGDASAGSVPVTPALVSLSGGVFEGAIAVNAVATGVVLTFTDPQGASGQSAALDVVAGPVAGFAFEPIASTLVNAPVPVTITARDEHGHPSTSFDQPVALSAQGMPASGPVRVLSFIAYANDEYGRTLSAIRAHFTDFTETSTTATDPATLAALLEQADVLLIPEQETATVAMLQNLGTSWASTLSAFVQRGGTVIVCTYATAEHEILVRAGLTSLSTFGSIGSYTVSRGVEHRLTTGVPASFPGSNLRYFLTPDPNATTLLHLVGYPNSVVREVGSGRAILIGTDFTVLGTPFDRVIANAVAWASEGRVGPLPIEPATTGAFSEGRWTGDVRFLAAGSAVTLSASDGAGHTGTSAPFEVQQLGSLALSTPPSGYEGDTATAVVSVSEAPAADLRIALTSSDPSALAAPSEVIIAAGTSQVAVDIDLVDDALLDGTQRATLQAVAPGYLAASATVDVLDDESAAVTLSLPASVTEGDGTLVDAGVVTLDRAANAALPITLASSDTTELVVPAQVVIPAGLSSARFDLSVQDDDRIDGTQTVTVTATFAGSPATTSIAVLDDEPRALTLSVPDGLTEHSDSFSVTVSLAGIAETDVTVALVSSDPAQVDIATEAVIAAGTSSVTASGLIVQDTLVEGQQTVTLRATSPGFDDAAAALVIIDDEAHHFAWDPVADPQTASLPFAVTLSAYGPDDLPVAYQGSALLEANGSSGSLPVSPTLASFVEGVFSGSIAIAAVDRDVTLRAVEPGGLEATSNAFDTVAGPLARFAVSTLPGVVAIGEPMPVTITAEDANGHLVSSYEGSPALSVLEGSNEPLRVLTYTAYSNDEYANTLAAIRASFTDFTETTTTTTSAAALQTLLASADVFLIVEQEVATNTVLQNLGTAFGPVLAQFVQDGGTVIACSYLAAEHEFFNRAGLFTVSGGGSLTSATLTRALDHELTEGVPGSFFGSYIRYYGTVSGGAEVPVRYSTFANVVARSVGRGHAVLIGTDFFTVGTPFDRVLANAVQLASGGRTRTVPSSPSVTGPFTGGTWTGAFTIEGPARQARLFVDDGAGHTGESNLFDSSGDGDGDGIDDEVERAGCTDPLDRDTDDDGIEDGDEDRDQDGVQSGDETDPCRADSDGDGLQDGTELGVTLSSVSPDTDLAVFEPDLDPTSTTDPLAADTDGDGVPDGVEDADQNGMLDAGETDPNVVEAPSGLTTSNLDWGLIRVGWSTAAPQSRLYRATACEGPYALVYEGSDRFVEDLVPAVCTTYFYRAAAVSSFGIESVWTPCHGEAHWCCDDGIPCTLDGFDGSACTHEPQDALCDDGEYCNGPERCDPGSGCRAGTAPDCDDRNPCTADACSSSARTCENVPLTGASCDDGDACTGGDVCTSDVCAGGVDLCRPDGDIFFDDFSAGLGRWTETGEGDWNTEPLHSSAGYPASASGSPAAHADTCTTLCTITTGPPIDLSGYSSAQLRFLRFVDSDLDAGEFLRVELWNGTSWVAPLPDWTHGSGDTNDWRLETIDLSAYLGRTDFAVRFSTRSSLYNEHVHVDDVRITVRAIECVVDADCDDGDVCTGVERCVEGACVPAGAIDCDDGDPCTTDSCHPTHGCQTELNTAPCEDGDPCTVGDACAVGMCRSGGPRSCDDGNVCTDERCEPLVGCVYDPNTTACDDGDACTGGDQCSAGACLGTIPLCIQPIFFDDFSAGLSRWTETGEGDWNTEALHTTAGYPSTGSSAPAAHSDACYTECRIELATPLNLTQYREARLELLRFVDSELDSGEYLRIELWNGTGWDRPPQLDWTHGAGDDNVWHAESMDLAPYLGVSDFRIRALTRSSLSIEHVHIDDVVILAL